MRNLFLLALLGISTLMVSCQSEAPAKGDEGAVHFGEVIDESGAKSVSEVLTMLETQEEVQTKIQGKVTDVCQAKGCWMNVVEGDNESGFFVKFHDYGFFVPKDLGGSTVVMEGKAYKEITTVEELKHYAEDEGASEEEIAAINEPVEEYKFMATGVKIIK